MTRVFSYIVSRDFGFAPNPFYGYCTLATCKPKIRHSAQVGDWIVGTGSKHAKLDGCMIYAMQVSEVLSFEAYWNDPRFFSKRPNLNGSLKQLYGDNIYHRDSNSAPWQQANSHHSLHDGSINPANCKKDTSVNRVLIANRFTYWGRDAMRLPSSMLGKRGICHAGVGHRVNVYEPQILTAFLALLDAIGNEGYLGDPYEFRTHRPVR